MNHKICEEKRNFRKKENDQKIEEIIGLDVNQFTHIFHDRTR